MLLFIINIAAHSVLVRFAFSGIPAKRIPDAIIRAGFDAVMLHAARNHSNDRMSCSKKKSKAGINYKFDKHKRQGYIDNPAPGAVFFPYEMPYFLGKSFGLFVHPILK